MIPGVNILKNAEELYTVKLTANSTEYFVTISARNEKGQKKVIDGKNFIKLHFESSFHTPFMTGQLQLDNSQEKTYLSISLYYFSKQRSRTRGQCCLAERGCNMIYAISISMSKTEI